MTDNPDCSIRKCPEFDCCALNCSEIGAWEWNCLDGTLRCLLTDQLLLGYDEGEIGRRREVWLALIHPDDLVGLQRAMSQYLKDQTRRYEAEFRIRAKNGEWVWLLARGRAVARTPEGAPARMVGTHIKIDRFKDLQQRLEYISSHDPLTGLHNRLMMSLLLGYALEHARRSRTRVALLLIDLDRFKHVNDSLGHAVGDELLVQVAQRLRSSLRQVDTISRLGGDEFTVVLENLRAPEDAARTARAIIDTMAEPFQLSAAPVQAAVVTEPDTEAKSADRRAPEAERESPPRLPPVHIGVSIGIALFPEHADSPHTLFSNADVALYRAKAEGRNCFVFYSEELTIASRARIELDAQLRLALRRDELRLHFQPQANLTDQRLFGAEALVRWQNPLNGLVPPAKFIPLAEETGLISEIGRWVLNETCRQGRRWLDAGLPPLTLAVNVSPRQLQHGDFVAEVGRALEESGYPAAGLELELVESAIAAGSELPIEMLRRLRAMGVRLAIDDFGTGYSSLSRLKELPLDVLKIDRSFIDSLPHDNDNAAIVATILAMGNIMGLQVLAEGVETEAQLDFLSRQNCYSYQGFLLSHPLPPVDLADLITRHGTIPHSAPAPFRSVTVGGGTGGILVVDDDSINLMALRRILQPLHYTIRTATNGGSALAAIAEEPPEIILLDISMPGMDGYALCEHLKNERGLRDIPIIFISGRNDTESVVRAFEAGGVDYIAKPFRSVEVVARVKTHLNLRRNRSSH